MNDGDHHQLGGSPCLIMILLLLFFPISIVLLEFSGESLLQLEFNTPAQVNLLIIGGKWII